MHTRAETTKQMWNATEDIVGDRRRLYTITSRQPTPPRFISQAGLGQAFKPVQHNFEQIPSSLCPRFAFRFGIDVCNWGN